MIYTFSRNRSDQFSSFFLPGSCHRKLAELTGYRYSQTLGLTNKWQETSVNKCHEHILLIIFIIYYWFTYIFIYSYSFLNDAVKDFWRDYR